MGSAVGVMDGEFVLETIGALGLFVVTPRSTADFDEEELGEAEGINDGLLVGAPVGLAVLSHSPTTLQLFNHRDSAFSFSSINEISNTAMLQYFSY